MSLFFLTEAMFPRGAFYILCYFPLSVLFLLQACKYEEMNISISKLLQSLNPYLHTSKFWTSPFECPTQP